MSRLTLVAVPLVLCLAVSIRAQETPTKVSNTTSTTAAMAPPVTTMTPREAMEMRGDIFMARKEYSSAVSEYDHILTSEPKNPTVLNKIGVAFSSNWATCCAPNMPTSVRCTRIKNFASAANNCGTVEYERKHYGKAIGLYKKAVALRGEMPTMYSNLGYAYFRNKEYPEAMSSFEKALSLDPTISTAAAKVARWCSSAALPIPVFFISSWPRPTRKRATPSVRRTI